MAALCRIHCAVDLKWGEAETMAMKKTWQLTSITSQAQNGAAGKWACRTRRNICLLPTCRHVSQYQSEETHAFHDTSKLALTVIKRAGEAKTER